MKRSAMVQHRRFAYLALTLVVSLAGCSPAGRRAPSAPTPPSQLPTRLVLGLDGIDYRDIVAAQAKGMFASFHPASRVVSTYPSISDIAWHEIFGVQAPRGYQRIYYSTGYNAIIGELLDAIRPIEFENRMDLAFDTKFHHLGAYIISNKVARNEIDKDVKFVFEFSQRETIYEYNVGPDALQHTRGDLNRYLQHLDVQLTALQQEYLARTGRPLEIVVLSDHGHNRAKDAKFLPMSDVLKSHGFRAADHLRGPNDVSFSVDGVTTGFGMFCDPDSVASVAGLLAAMPGVDLVTTRESDSRFRILTANGVALVERRAGTGGELFRYVTVAGDPLRYNDVLVEMRRAGAMDADGYANEANWLKFTATHEYPAAPPRIVRGHTTVTLNPAPILASLNDKYRVGLGMLSLADRLHPLGGTHGSLSATNSLGVLMTNFMDTHDALTTNVRDQLGGFGDLGAPDWKSPGARVTSSTLLNADRLSPFHAMLATPEPHVGIELWLTPRLLDWAADSASFVVDVRRRNGAEGDTMPGNRLIWPMQTVTQSADHLHYFLPLPLLGLTALDANTTYEVRLALHHLKDDKGTPRSTNSKVLTTIKVRTNETGVVWPH